MNPNHNPNHTPPPPAPTANNNTTSTPNSATPRANRSRRRPDLTLPLPQREPRVPHPLPLPPSSNSPPSTSHYHHHNNNTTTIANNNNNHSATTGDPHRPVQYRINFTELERVNRIGSGSGGTVYKVFHRPSGRHFALKVIYGHHDESILKQIVREVEIVRGVNNPNVVKCHDVSDHGGEIQVLLEYMDCGSLEGTHLQNERHLSHLTYQILSGLAYLHRSKIVHRDIKPSNLLVNSRKQVKIADFGVSRVLSQTMDPCNSSVGTIAYMSPERINTDLNHGRYDGYAGDIWSFGLSILEFYLGRFPFAVGRGGDWASLMCAICMSDPPEAPVTASRDFRDFISCCLQRDPARRWTAARLLKHPFIVNNNPQSQQTNLHQLLPPPRPVSS